MDYWIITEAWIKRYTPLTEFVDMEIVRPFFKLGEEIDVRGVLGEKLFNRLKEGVELNNLTSDEVELLDNIRPFLAYAIVARSNPFIATGIRGSGIVKVANPNIQNATLAEVKDLQTNLNNMRDYYQKRLIDYLCLNNKKFPLYYQLGNPSSNSTPNWSIGGVYFGCGCSGKCWCK
jgi:hypothetical protein